jgi:hypothetical protein
MDDRTSHKARSRFYAALVLFLLWVAALGAMAVVTGRRPAPNPAAGGGP